MPGAGGRPIAGQCLQGLQVPFRWPLNSGLCGCGVKPPGGTWQLGVGLVLLDGISSGGDDVQARLIEMTLSLSNSIGKFKTIPTLNVQTVRVSEC